MLDEQALKNTASHIKLLICDIDGVMTNGQLHYNDDGMAHKSFHVHDGFGLQLLMQQAIPVAVITACTSNINATRLNHLGIPHVYRGQRDKMVAYEQLVQQLNINDQHVAYIGDDLPDLPIIERVGLGVAVANANPIVAQQAAWITSKKGGEGAVREVCDLILQAQNALFSALEKWQQQHG